MKKTVLFFFKSSLNKVIFSDFTYNWWGKKSKDENLSKFIFFKYFQKKKILTNIFFVSMEKRLKPFPSPPGVVCPVLTEITCGFFRTSSWKAINDCLKFPSASNFTFSTWLLSNPRSFCCKYLSWRYTTEVQISITIEIVNCTVTNTLRSVVLLELLESFPFNTVTGLNCAR